MCPAGTSEGIRSAHRHARGDTGPDPGDEQSSPPRTPSAARTGDGGRKFGGDLGAHQPPSP